MDQVHTSKIGLWTVFWKTAIERKRFKKRNGWWTCVKWGSPMMLFNPIILAHKFRYRDLKGCFWHPIFCTDFHPESRPYFALKSWILSLKWGKLSWIQKTCWGPSKTVSYSSKPPTQTFFVSFHSFLSPECLWGS